MGNSWYKKSMPKIRTIKPHIKKMAIAISKIDGVKSVLAWGSYAQNHNKPNYIIGDIDIIAVSSFFSEDFISIVDDQNSPFKIASSELEDLGFDPRTVEFTKKFIQLEKYNVDPWVISSDDKLLHWGPMPQEKEEWDEITNEARTYSDFSIGVSREELHKVSQKIKDKWKLTYDHYVNKFISDMPRGWYQSKNHISEILSETIRII